MCPRFNRVIITVVRSDLQNRYGALTVKVSNHKYQTGPSLIKEARINDLLRVCWRRPTCDLENIGRVIVACYDYFIAAGKEESLLVKLPALTETDVFSLTKAYRLM